MVKCEGRHFSLYLRECGRCGKVYESRSKWSKVCVDCKLLHYKNLNGRNGGSYG